MVPEKEYILNSEVSISSSNSMSDDLLELPHRDDSDKMSNILFGG